AEAARRDDGIGQLAGYRKVLDGSGQCVIFKPASDISSMLTKLGLPPRRFYDRRVMNSHRRQYIGDHEAERASNASRGARASGFFRERLMSLMKNGHECRRAGLSGESS